MAHGVHILALGSNNKQFNKCYSSSFDNGTSLKLDPQLQLAHQF
jgi:hypothetical protein